MKITLLSYTPNPETNIASAARICYDSKPKTLEEERKFIKGLVNINSSLLWILVICN